MTAIIRLPMSDAAYARITERQRQANVAAEADTKPKPYARYDAAYSGLLSAGDDWPAMLGFAHTLADIPRWPDQELARHTREAYSRHLRQIIDGEKHKASEPGMIRFALLDVVGLAVFFAAVLFVIPSFQP